MIIYNCDWRILVRARSHISETKEMSYDINVNWVVLHRAFVSGKKCIPQINNGVPIERINKLNQKRARLMNAWVINDYRCQKASKVKQFFKSSNGAAIKTPIPSFNRFDHRLHHHQRIIYSEKWKKFSLPVSVYPEIPISQPNEKKQLSVRQSLLTQRFNPFPI